MLQAAQEGIWDLQPAVDRMTEQDRERAKEVNRCENLLNPERDSCMQEWMIGHDKNKSVPLGWS